MIIDFFLNFILTNCPHNNLFIQKNSSIEEILFIIYYQNTKIHNMQEVVHLPENVSLTTLDNITNWKLKHLCKQQCVFSMMDFWNRKRICQWSCSSIIYACVDAMWWTHVRRQTNNCTDKRTNRQTEANRWVVARQSRSMTG